MPAILNWLLRLLITNPICMRLVQGGSRRVRHLYIRAGYLGVMIAVLLLVLLNSIAAQPGGGSLSMRELASGGAAMFTAVSYLQVGLICVLAPVFMAGAIAQEANPRTWDILLTTPLNSLQIVLGNLFGRLFFILALLFSSLPLFAVTQYFGGVQPGAIIASYAIAGASALLVAAIAITLSVTRTAGRRAVFVFYVTVVMYLFATYAVDLQIREPVRPGAAEVHTTLLTPLNPFLALEVLLRSNTYVPHDFTGATPTWIAKVWLSRPIATFIWLCVGISTVLVAFSSAQVRAIGARAGTISLRRRVFAQIFRTGAEGARQPRRVGHNPIAWREAVARGKSLPALVGRWGFCGLGVLAAIVLIALFHFGVLSGGELQAAVATVVGAEIVVIVLAALNMSATAVSREREDGGLDLILTTPIEPGPYIAGKLKGLIQFLVPMMLVPIITMLLLSLYVMSGGLGREGGAMATATIAATPVTLPLVLPEGALALPLVLVPFVAFSVMVGLQWSIKSKGTIGAVTAAVGIVLAVAGVISLCGLASGGGMGVLGGVLNAFSPATLLFAIVYPADAIPSALGSGIGAGRVSLVIGAVIAAAVYGALVYGMHTNIKRTFMMTVRRLAGTN
jgi:ABC-type transport system involved in multi-copper enzyme maturation permease subunit